MRIEYVLPLLIVGILNIWVALKVVRSASFSIKQKIGIIVFIFIFPVLGAVAVYLFIKSDDEGGGPRKPGVGGGMDPVATELGGNHNPMR